MRVFVDTHVFVYIFDRDEPEKSRLAQKLMEREDLEFAISTQVLQEFYVAVTRKLARPLPVESAKRAVRDLARLAVQPVTSSLIFSAISLSQRDGFSFWDAMIVEAALRSGAEQLVSEDMQDGRIIDGMEIRNPFAR